MKKQVFFLKDESVPKIQTEWPLITWCYKWDGVKFAYSPAFKEMLKYYYWPN